MSIIKEVKTKLIKEFAQSEQDTGSPEVQCAVLTEHIKNLTEHFRNNKKDFQSRRGLIVMVNKRKRLLNYLKENNMTRYQSLIERLGLRK